MSEIQTDILDLPPATWNMSPRFDSIPPFRGRPFTVWVNEVGYGELEPAHVHITLQEGEAKFWLVDGSNNAKVTLADAGRVPARIITKNHKTP